jgi:hypothetical protein
MWLCLPGRADPCSGDLAATAVQPDGTRVLEPPLPEGSPPADCFYVYPTVDMGVFPGNHEDFSDLAPMTDAAIAQAARFRQVCSLYVPLYRQANIGTYVVSGPQLEQRLEFAYSDVEAAFRRYLEAYDRGHPIVLLGHSQGAHILKRLVQRLFDHDAGMRSRLLVAILLGGDVQVPKGKVVGATFDKIPLCTGPYETGCVIAYRSHEEGAPIAPGPNLPDPGNQSACVDPAGLSDVRHAFTGSYIPLNDKLRSELRGVADVKTPFVAFHDFYTGRCTDGPEGYRYMAISLAGAPGDTRVNPVNFKAMPLRRTLGLHPLDFQIPQEDLIEAVARRERALRGLPGRP